MSRVNEVSALVTVSEIFIGPSLKRHVKQDVRFPAAGRSRPCFSWLGGGFTREDIGRFEEQGLRLPHTDSISRWLIEEWLKGEPA
ncbi:MAG: hypothetical protein V3R22_01990 [Kiloniellales bacterium]